MVIIKALWCLYVSVCVFVVQFLSVRCCASAVFCVIDVIACPSVTSWYCVKMAKCRISETAPHDCPGTPFYYAKDLYEIPIV